MNRKHQWLAFLGTLGFSVTASVLTTMLLLRSLVSPLRSVAAEEFVVTTGGKMRAAHCHGGEAGPSVAGPGR